MSKCKDGCQYAKDVGMLEYRCAKQCLYVGKGGATKTIKRLPMLLLHLLARLAILTALGIALFSLFAAPLQ